MVNVLIGDMFESKAQTLVNTVNCVGVMGKGIALEFKNRFPDMFDDYINRCKRNEVKLGKPYLFRKLVPPWILNFPTKDHWRSVSNIDSIVQGLKYLLQHYQEWDVTSLAVPPLGCGHGQLEWRIVGPTLYRFLSRMEIPVELYAPYGTPHKELQPEFLAEKTIPSPDWIQPAQVALVEILHRVEQEPYHWTVGRTTFQKMAFVATMEGIPTGLRYQRGSYGPFSPGLKGVITQLVNNGLIREERLGRMYAIKVGPTYADALKAYTKELAQWDSTMNKIADLFMRLRTSQSEIVATVLFTARSLYKEKKTQPTEAEVLHEVIKWKQRRHPPLEEQDVAHTIRNLAALSWLKVRASRDLPLPKEDMDYVQG